MRKTLYALAALLSTLIGLYPLLYIMPQEGFGVLGIKERDVLSLLYWQVSFYLHISMAGFALLIGWLQFSRRLRYRRPRLHRLIGKMYVFTALPGSAAGIALSFYTTGGFVPAAGFFVLGVIWFYTTASGYTTARKREFAAHERLMYYSYACCFAAVMLRLWLPVLLRIFDFPVAYSIVAWLCWVPNLAVAYLMNRHKKIPAL